MKNYNQQEHGDTKERRLARRTMLSYNMPCKTLNPRKTPKMAVFSPHNGLKLRRKMFLAEETMSADPINEFLSTLSVRTRQRYEAALADFSAWYRDNECYAQTNGEDPDFELLSPVEVQDYVQYLQTIRRLAPASINLRLAAIRSLLKHLGRSLRLRGPKQVVPPVRALSARELGRLLAAAEGEGWTDRRNLAMLDLMARAGLRVGEVVSLTPSDLEINGRSGWLTVRSGKGNKTRRVPLNSECRAALQAYLAVRPQGEQSTCVEPRRNIRCQALFLSRSFLPLSSRDVQRLVSDLARHAGLTDVTPHTLRHTFATRAVEKGVDLATLAAMLGHSRLETTGRYLHPTAERMQEAVEGV